MRDGVGEDVVVGTLRFAVTVIALAVSVAKPGSFGTAVDADEDFVWASLAANADPSLEWRRPVARAVVVDSDEDGVHLDGTRSARGTRIIGKTFDGRDTHWSYVGGRS